MPTLIQLRARAKELNAEVQAKIAACERGDLSVKAFQGFMAAAQSEDAELADQIAGYTTALSLTPGLPGESGAPQAGVGSAFAPATDSDNGKRLTFGAKPQSVD